MNPPDSTRHGIGLPFAKLSTTRWLCRGKVIYNILTNWDELVHIFLVLNLTVIKEQSLKHV